MSSLKEIQGALTNLGFQISKNGKPDNLFGKRTKEALEKALISKQDANGCSIDSTTFDALRKLVDEWKPTDKTAVAFKNSQLSAPSAQYFQETKANLLAKFESLFSVNLSKSKDEKSLNFKALREEVLKNLDVAMDPQSQPGTAVTAMKNFFDALRGSKGQDTKEAELLSQFPNQIALKIMQRAMELKKLEVLPQALSPVQIPALTQPTPNTTPSTSGFGKSSIPVTKDVAKKEKELQARVNPQKTNAFGNESDAKGDQGKLLRNLLFTHGHTKQLNTHVTWADAFARGDFNGLPKDQLKQADDSLVRFLSRSDLNRETVSNYLEHSINSQTPVDDVRRMAAEALVAIRTATRSEGLRDAQGYLNSLPREQNRL